MGEVRQRINQSEPGFPPMPPSGIKVDDCKLAKIGAWVNTGLPDN
ncbi:MAG: hypothetical protein U5L96_04355 [Owenweeksia sp.]|nr:hypothetical protein [Owenweeksia sp.]